MDPLETRSLPQGLWQYVPSAVVEADLALQRAFVDFSAHHPYFWRGVVLMTERPIGIATAFLLIFGFLAYRLRRALRRVGPAAILLALVWLVLALGISDLTASALKVVVGRLKPHVNFYNPAFIPALSFPSNHAFNSSFLFGLALWLLPRPGRRIHVALLATLLMCVAASRVFLGQHYPLDVTAGLVLGFLASYLARPVLRRLPPFRARRAAKRSTRP